MTKGEIRLAVKVYIDGQEGTTGLRITERFSGRDDIELLRIDEDKRKDTEERKRLIHLLKNFELTIKGFRPVEEAIITSGGINTKEINPKTMESKLVSGLYFAGEVIDVDAYTGGFNLQIAFSTGYCAGKNY